MTPPNKKVFCEHINFVDCSKVSDGASSLVVASEKGLEKLGVKKEDCVEIVGFACAEGDITQDPEDLTYLATSAKAGNDAMEMAGIKTKDVGLLELHDCFTITGIIALESIGFAERGKGPQFVLDGNTAPEGSLPTNTTGGLVGFGHPVGATGVRQTVDLLHQLTGKADNQINLKKDYGMMVNMGGNDKTVVSIVVKRV